MWSKAKIYNIALGALLLTRKISDPETDASNEAKVLNTHWDAAFRSTLEDMDLDCTSTPVTLELYESDPVDRWSYAYRYPTNCAFFRRLESSVEMDNRTTRLKYRVAMHEGKKVIFTNEENATAEIIDIDVPYTALSANAGLAIAYKLAFLASPFIVGKGADRLRKGIMEMYVIHKAEAQEHDRRENFNYPDPEVESEFVEERLS